MPTTNPQAFTNWLIPIRSASASGSCAFLVLGHFDFALHNTNPDIKGSRAEQSTYVFNFQEQSSEIYIPNVFSPNDDGINDLFALSFGSDLDIRGITGSIFDRWGNLVFSSDAITFA